MPLIKDTGINTARSIAEIAIIANAISFVPSIAAFNLLIPASIFLYIFSRTTIASSMMIPIDKVRPTRVILFKSKPIKSIKAIVPMIEMGIDNADTNVIVIFLRKKNTIITAKNAP